VSGDRPVEFHHDMAVEFGRRRRLSMTLDI
jgi:hypothetical protein